MAEIPRWYGSEGYDPYGVLIEGWASRAFPQIGTTSENLVDTLTDVFVATKQYRVGPKPNIESLVRIRETLRFHVERGLPIPILIPAAAVKVPIGESLDLAELSILRVLQCLIEQVSKHYTPGIFIRIRLEDLTEHAISSGTKRLAQHIETYTTQFRALVRALGLHEHIELVSESDYVTREQFLSAVEHYSRYFRDYLDTADDPGLERVHGEHLAALGWNGGVSPAFREFLDTRYQRLYPDLSRYERIDLAAQYLSAILARRAYRAVGTFAHGQLEISFAPPMPDAPLVSTRVYYRSVPLSESSNHQPFWNAKGHIRIGADNSVRIALGKWDDEYVLGQLDINGVVIRADYALED
jgi:hypothetical protein